MKNTIYLLTGAAGYLGSNISRALIRENKKVRTLVLKGDPAIKYVPEEAEIVIGDLLDKKSLKEFFTVPKESEIIVIHCASMVTVSPEPNEKEYNINVNGTKNIIDECIKHNVKKLVYISSTSAIPELEKGRKISEVTSFNPDSVIGYYGKTKAEATQAVMDAVNKRGLDASIVFPSGICGPNDYANGYFTNFIIDCVNGKMPAGVAGSFNAVDVRDLAEGVIACAHNGHKGEGYIMGNCIVGMSEMFQIISKYAGCSEVKTILPIPVAKFLAAIMSVISKINKKPALLTSFAIYNLDRNNEFDFSKAKRELGYKVRPFEETIRDSIAWLAKENKIKLAGVSKEMAQSVNY
ncbi:MAG: putative nucleoside-diphosphate-sugar epimerase [Eubacterium sp.]|nr:putative nucleoside-diphosphate-sugar epimerase [Eubacterium sp.]